MEYILYIYFIRSPLLGAEVVYCLSCCQAWCQSIETYDLYTFNYLSNFRGLERRRHKVNEIGLTFFHCADVKFIALSVTANREVVQLFGNNLL